MRIGPIAHAALLVAALGFAYQTWTRDKSEAPKVGTVTVWNEPLDDFEAFAYDGENKSVRVEKRSEGSDTFYWGQVTRTEKKKKKRVPVKAPADQGPGGGHGGPPGMGGHGDHASPPGQPGMTPGAAPKPAAVPKPTTAPGSAAPGGAPSPKTPQSPHHTGTDQPGAAPSTPAKPAAAPSTPAKPAAPAGDKPAVGAPPSEPASSEPASSEGGDEGEDGEDGAGQDSAPEPAEPEQETPKTKEFPVGVGGKAVIANLSHLHALRDLGVLTDKQKEEYELTESKENLAVFFKGGKKHSLTLGSRVFGGGDRYVLDVETGKGYVISNSEIMRHIDGAESSLGLKGLHEFQDERDEEPLQNNPNAVKERRDRYAGVNGLELETPHGSRAMVRFEEKDAATGNTIVGWAPKDKAKEQDVTFGNLVSQIDKLRPLEYDKDLDASAMTKVMTLKYLGSGGKQIAYLDLYRKEPAVTPELEPSEETKKANEAQYYVKSEITRSFGKISRMSAERITEDLPQLFGAPPPPDKGKGKGKGEEAAAPTIPPEGAAPAPAKSGTDNPAKQPADKPVPSQPQK